MKSEEGATTVKNMPYVYYVYLNGLAVDRIIHLPDDIDLLPAKSSFSRESLLTLGKDKENQDLAAILNFLPYVKSQIRAEGEKDVETFNRALHACHNIMLLGSLIGANVMDKILSDVPIEQLTEKSQLSFIDYSFVGNPQDNPPLLKKEDISWIEKHYKAASFLLSKALPPNIGDESYYNAVHCLSSYHWHPASDVGLAILWSGIEGLFKAKSEIAFKLSLYIARFLAPESKEEQRLLFEQVKKLYNLRSEAVHGAAKSDTNKIMASPEGVCTVFGKGKMRQAVEESAELLRRLVRKCAEIASLPDTRKLAP
ncbi:MAG: HEPN domain-containing protein [Betaproteobacteria bacterium]|nr:HEPN domain-containing protein [Betaproteobacteria bacterium]